MVATCRRWRFSLVFCLSAPRQQGRRTCSGSRGVFGDLAGGGRGKFRPDTPPIHVSVLHGTLGRVLRWRDRVRKHGPSAWSASSLVAKVSRGIDSPHNLVVGPEEAVVCNALPNSIVLGLCLWCERKPALDSSP